jgi:hypothetical protein
MVLRMGFNVTLPRTLPVFFSIASYSFRYAHECNFIYTQTKSATFTAPIFTKLTTTNFSSWTFLNDTKRMKNIENTGKMLFSSLSKILISLHRCSRRSLFNCFMWWASVPNLTQIGHEIWSVGRINYSLRKIWGLFNKRPTFLDSVLTSIESALWLLSAPSVRFWQQTAICLVSLWALVVELHPLNWACAQAIHRISEKVTMKQLEEQRARACVFVCGILLQTW